MSGPIQQAKASLERWNAAFNAQDMDGMVAEMHFPHSRLSGENKFQVWDTSDDYRASGESRTATRNAQGWDHTVATSVEAVQAGADKVHLAIKFSRLRADGSEYCALPSLWIFSSIDERWGIQFRSSFLRGPVERGDVSS